MAFRMLQELAKQKEKCVFMSPLGLYYALSMASDGAVGQTKKEIDNLLAKNDNNRENVDELYRKVMLKDASNRGYISNIVDSNGDELSEDTINASWMDIYNNLAIDPEIKNINEEYIDLLADKYFAKTTFDGESQKIKINNELKFNGRWLESYDKSNTKLRPFHHNKQSWENVSMMETREYYRYSKGDGYQMIAIPYTNGYYMNVLLPDSIETLDSMIPKLNEKVWSKHIADMDVHRITKEEDMMYDQSVRNTFLRFPKLKFDEEYDLSSIAKNLGMNTGFTDKADFSSIFIDEPSPVSIKAITQKVKIDVSEEKTVAEGKTELIISELCAISVKPDKTPNPNIIFYCDHPFLYFITDRYGSICFMGIFR